MSRAAALFSLAFVLLAGPVRPAPAAHVERPAIECVLQAPHARRAKTARAHLRPPARPAPPHLLPRAAATPLFVKHRSLLR